MRSLAASIVLLTSCAAQPHPATISNRSPTTAPLAVAIVFSGQEIWVGNDDFETDPNATYPGALHGIERAIDKLVLPGGSIGTVIAYSTGAETIVAMAPAINVKSSQLGGQKKYRNKIGADLVVGVLLALDQLEKAAATRRILIVIGDGNDTDNATAKRTLAEQARRAAAAHIAVRAIILKSVLSNEAQVISTLAPDAQTISSASELDSVLPNAVGVAR
jgi:hypothetical protein